VLSLLTFSAAAVLIVLLPGPDTLVVVRSLLRGGRGTALKTAAGVCSGLCVWVIVATVGLSAALRASKDGYLALRIAGAVYLAVLGVQALRSRGVSAEIDQAELEAAGSRKRGGLLGTGYATGLVTDLLNPKVGVFFVSFLPAFIPAHHNVTAWSLLLGAIFVVLTAAYFVALLFFADRVMHGLRRPTTRKRLDRLTGLVLIGFGARLVFE
jgi:threonine/homoserine/homoserine lactone efflux protein